MSAYEFVPTSLAVSRMSGSSNLDFVMGGRWPYSCFVGCCLQDLPNMIFNNGAFIIFIIIRKPLDVVIGILPLVYI